MAKATRPKAGHPPKYETAELLLEKASEYFDYCKDKEKIPNIAGFCWFADFVDRHSFSDQEKRSPKFSAACKKIKTRLYAEKFDLASTGKMNVSTFIFDAVNNHGMFNTRTENKNDNKLTGQVIVLSESDKKL